MTTEQVKLNPCPNALCRSVDVMVSIFDRGGEVEYVVGCCECGVAAQGAEYEDHAIQLWNHRPNPPSPDAGERREAIARIIDPDEFRRWQGMYDYSIRVGDNEEEARACADWAHGKSCDEARAKADAILALKTSTPETQTVEGGGRLGWHMPDNLRWLAEQSDRPAYMPCGVLTGMFLNDVAERLETLVAEKHKPTTPERSMVLEEAAFNRGVESAALIADRYWSSNLNPASLPEAIRALSASPIEVEGVQSTR